MLIDLVCMLCCEYTIDSIAIILPIKGSRSEF